MTIVEYYERPISTIVIIYTTRLLNIYHPSFHGSTTFSHHMNAYKTIIVSGGTGWNIKTYTNVKTEFYNIR